MSDARGRRRRRPPPTTLADRRRRRGAGPARSPASGSQPAAVELQVGLQLITSHLRPELARRRRAARRGSRSTSAVGRVAAEGDPHVAVGQHAHRRQHVRWARGSRRCRPSRWPRRSRAGRARATSASPSTYRQENVTRWGSRSSGSPTTSTSGIRATAAPDPVDQRVLPGVDAPRARPPPPAARRPRPAPRARSRTPRPRSSTRSSSGKGLRQRAPLRTAARRRRPGRPTCARTRPRRPSPPGRGSRPVDAHASTKSGTSSGEPRPRRPAGGCPPRGWPSAARRPPCRRAAASLAELARVDTTRARRPRRLADLAAPGGRVAAPRSARPRSGRPWSPRREPRSRPEQAAVHRLGAGRGEASPRRAAPPGTRPRRPGRCRAAAARCGPPGAGAAGRRTPGRARPAVPRGRPGAAARTRRSRGAPGRPGRARPRRSSRRRTYSVPHHGHGRSIRIL